VSAAASFLATPAGHIEAAKPHVAAVSKLSNADTRRTVPEKFALAKKGDRADLLRLASAPGRAASAATARAFHLAEPYAGQALALKPRDAGDDGASVVLARFHPAARSTADAPARTGKSAGILDRARAESREMAAETSPVLAYAPPSESIEAPFDAVIGGEAQTPAGESSFTPRARPDPAKVLTWLKGRALGQFAPGQHDWVQNELPAVVHTANEQKCLAEAIYFEARGEPELGQAAVAQVVLNRVRAPSYPDTICDVVYQNKSWRNRCQFSFACDGQADKVRSERHWRMAQRIAKDVTEGRIWLEDVGDSTHYYANYVRPRWARKMIKMDTIGAHLFYRTKLGGWS